MSETTTPETSKKNRSTGFYEAKGMRRATVIFNPGYLERLEEIAKHHDIAKGDVVEVLLDNCALDTMIDAFQARQREKGQRPSGRVTKSAIVKKMKDASPETLAAIEKILAGGQKTEGEAE